ncbi:hypothetical protein [Spirosoma sp. KNUC1025]|uniref:hypothetical protein n=1 Tax=Spirosoma sp. KNUC1025 TaxID=2894082 RepID=UPI0038639431|nr:hypothetical protein LN737_00085 [Spirosoma sp. KNUC1025]
MNRPQNEPNTIERIDGHFYTRLAIMTPQRRRHQVFFFVDRNEPGGLYRYEVPYADWYIFTVVDKLDKLPVQEQWTISRELVFNLWRAIRLRHQKEENAYECEPPRCLHSRLAVEKWINRIFNKYESQ